MSNKRFDRARIGIGIAGGLLLASCAGAEQAAGGDKAGGDADPVVLTMADATAGLVLQPGGAALRRPGRGAVRRRAADRRAKRMG